MSEAKVVQKFPFKTHVEKWKSFYLCKCGLISKHPFCDVSHDTTNFLPERIVFEEDKDVFFCGCKKSAKGALCDGTHKNIE